MVEVWKDIKDFEGLYQVSNLGRVRSLDRTVYQINPRSGNYFTFNYKGKILKQMNMSGYLVVSLSKDNIKNKYKIHRLVALSFLSNPENKREVNHIDGDKFNNNLSNLEWATSRENQIHAYETGLQLTGAFHGRSKLSEEDAIWILKNHIKGDLKFGASALARKFGIDKSSLCDLVNRKTWKHIQL